MFLWVKIRTKKYDFQICLYRSIFNIHLAIGNENEQNLFTLRNGDINEQLKWIISQIAIALVQNILKFMVIRAKVWITKITPIPAKL